MNDSHSSKRRALFREAAVFQLKLMADGLRDFVLVPVSLFAALAGLLRGGSEPDREFRQVIELGRQSEQWINLFGNHEPAEGQGPGSNLDDFLRQAEEVVREQARQGGITEGAAVAIRKALRPARSGRTRESDLGDESANGAPPGGQ